jgi:hypothetical protein
MAKNHPVHSGIAGVLRHIIKKSTEKIELKLSPECTGEHNLPLYIKEPEAGETKSENELCNVDAMILKDNNISIIIEIEESGFLPTKICGKYLTSNLARIYKYKDIESIEINNASILFIQVVDIQEQGNVKQKQFEHIETAINNLLNMAFTEKFEIGCINKYKIIQVNGKTIMDCPSSKENEDEKEYNKSEYKDLISIIETELGK